MQTVLVFCSAACYLGLLCLPMPHLWDAVHRSVMCVSYLPLTLIGYN